MDPDATWSRIRSLRAKQRRRGLDTDERDELRELQEALSNWLRRGGFSPKGMTPAMRRHRR